MTVYVQTYKSLSWVSLTQDQHDAKTCGYWYVVVQESYAPHTAFRTRESFLAWCETHGLTIDPTIVPAAGTWANGKIGGAYRRASHLGTRNPDSDVWEYVGGYDDFFALKGRRVRCMDNADVTLGIITDDSDGLRTLHHLNCNMRDRPIFPRDASTIEGY